MVSWCRVAVSDLERAALRHRHCVRRPSGPAELSESLGVGGFGPVNECDGQAGHDYGGQFQCELEKDESEGLTEDVERYWSGGGAEVLR